MTQMRAITRLRCIYGIGIALTLASAVHLYGQTVDLATITTDTGDYATGHRDFTRYNQIQLCMMAAKREIGRGYGTYTANIFSDTVDDKTQDTLPTRVVQVVRACMAHLPLVTPSQELPSLLDLALYANNDSVVHAAQERLIDEAVTSKAKDTVRLYLIDKYLQARPERLAAAEELATKIDAEGAQAIRQEIIAHWDLLNAATWEMLTKPKMSLANTRRGDHEAEIVIKLMMKLNVDSLDYSRSAQSKEGTYELGAGASAFFMLSNAYSALLFTDFSNEPNDSSRVRKDAKRAQNDFRRFKDTSVTNLCMNFYRVPCYHIDPKTTPLDTIQMVLNPYAYFGYFRPDQEDTVRRLHADFWFPITRGDSIQPEKGRLAFFIYSDNVLVGEPNLWETSASDIGAWIQHGIKVTIVHHARGVSWFGDSVPPQVEAEQVRWAYQDYYHLLVNVAVIIDHFRKLPEPDGRRIDDSSYICSQQLTIDCGSERRVDRNGYITNYSGQNPKLFVDSSGHLLNIAPYVWMMLHPLGPTAVSGTGQATVVPISTPFGSGSPPSSLPRTPTP